ncbi:adaptin ear-binding coat-associated protein 2-like [Anneissia japonica]|uniref:adaptin ear-binding coat-associated protein 2-like n=1 Tax=Anneissia japonica TaxID=1529436 RepID=UPI001425A25D|nr:adaptin ear-binding coat-associated protein 2-like [Anneissia japonica]
MADYESVLCVKPEAFVYKIPPRATNRGYRAADWKLDQPDWTGRLKVIAKGKSCFVKLEDKSTGELFAECPVDAHPGMAVEGVMDSSRYFVLRIQDGTGRKAFIGVGFADRGDSFDFNVALQDHFKWIKQEKKIEDEQKQAALDPGPKLDLGFKEGQTITINLGTKKAAARPRGSGMSGGAPGLLPPPPGAKGGIIAPPPTRPSNQPSQGVGAFGPPPQQQHSQPDILGGFASQPSKQNPNIDLLGGVSSSTPQQNSDWGDFTSANTQPSSNSNQGGWVQF